MGYPNEYLNYTKIVIAVKAYICYSLQAIYLHLLTQPSGNLACATQTIQGETGGL